MGTQLPWAPAGGGRQTFRGTLKMISQKIWNCPYQGEHGFQFLGIWGGHRKQKASELLATTGIIPNLLKKRSISLPLLHDSGSFLHNLVQVSTQFLAGLLTFSEIS
jgi:hypothetical protein